MSVRVREIATAQGLARVHLRRPTGANSATATAVAGATGAVRGTVLLGHGAGGGVGAPDLAVAQTAALASGWVVGLVEQPWRVAGKKVASPPPRLDEAWTEIVAALRRGRGAVPGPLIFGGRSAGARVACRLAGPLDALAVLTLAFPLHPPGRPERSRADELAAAVGAVPVLAVQGRTDAFGNGEEIRTALAGRPAVDLEVLDVPGDHGLKAIGGPAGSALRDWFAAR